MKVRSVMGVLKLKIGPACPDSFRDTTGWFPYGIKWNPDAFDRDGRGSRPLPLNMGGVEGGL